MGNDKITEHITKVYVGNCTGTPVGIETPTRTRTRGGYIPVNPRVRVPRVRVYIRTGVDPPCGFDGFPGPVFIAFKILYYHLLYSTKIYY